MRTQNEEKKQTKNKISVKGLITLFQCADITAGMTDSIGMTVNAPLGNKIY